MAKRILRDFIKGFGEQLIRFDLGVVMALIVALASLVYTNGFIVSDWLRFVGAWFGIALLFIFGFQLFGHLLIWLSNSIKLLDVEQMYSYPHYCNIKITNRYGEDLTDFRMELKRLTIVGYRIDCTIENKKPFFSTGLRIENNTIKSKDTATIFIAEIPSNKDDSYLMEFMIDEGWKSTYKYDDISSESEERKKSMGELSGIIYEFVIEITGKVGKDYIKPQVYRGRILYLSVIQKHQPQPHIQWLRLDEHSMKKEEERGINKWRPDKEVITSKEDFFTFLWQMKEGKNPDKNKKDPIQNKDNL